MHLTGDTKTRVSKCACKQTRTLVCVFDRLWRYQTMVTYFTQAFKITDNTLCSLTSTDDIFQKTSDLYIFIIVQICQVYTSIMHPTPLENELIYNL